MTNKLTTILVILAGLFSAYAFYAFWHSEEINPPKTIQKDISIDNTLENKKVISKNTKIQSKDIITPKPKPLLVSKEFRSQEIIEEEANDIYEALVPAAQDEFVEEANDAFDAFDNKVIEMEETLQAEEENIEESVEKNEDLQDSVEDTEDQNIEDNTEESPMVE
jgi:lipopolysaccharide export LptBFGC system permease protein LptF